MSRLKHRLARLAPRQLGTAAANRRAILAFAEAAGLVHFGFVDQHDDEHRIVRGATVSTHHTDSHYCIGTFNYYDVSFVERSDILRQPKEAVKGGTKPHTWHIIQIDLTTKLDLPHVFLGLHSHSDAFYQQLFHKYPMFSELRLGVLQPQPPQFLSKYRVYGVPAHALDVERLLPPATTTLIADHFGSVAIEIEGNALYLYAEHKHLTVALLMTMLENGIWLANQIDAPESL